MGDERVHRALPRSPGGGQPFPAGISGRVPARSLLMAGHRTLSPVLKLMHVQCPPKSTKPESTNAELQPAAALVSLPRPRTSVHLSIVTL